MQPVFRAWLQGRLQGFRVLDLGFWVSGSGCRAQSFGIRISGFGLQISGSGGPGAEFRVWGSGLRVPSAGFRGSSFEIGVGGFDFGFPVFGFRVSGLRGERRALKVDETRRQPAVRGRGLRVRVLDRDFGFRVLDFGLRAPFS
jgi:hypothetical protein